MLIDVGGVDTMGDGSDEWDTGVSSQGFSRGVSGKGPGRFRFGEVSSEQMPQPQGVADIEIPQRRFAVVVQLLSVQPNRSVSAPCFAPDDQLPVVDTVTDLGTISR